MTKRNYSFVIPAYNDEAGIRRHLEYFFSRPETIQLVIVDDCSTDKTGEVIKKAKPPANVTLTYHRQPKNAGPARARNEGLELATNDYVMFLDADDVLAGCFFDYIALSPLENGADFVLFKYHLARTPDELYTYEMHQVDNAAFTRVEQANFPVGTHTLAEFPQVLNTVNFPWNKVYRRDFLKSAKIHFPDLRMHEDIPPHWDSFLRCERFGLLSWAPPLLTHFEFDEGHRATNYIGEQRLGIFPELQALFREIRTHPQADLVVLEFKSFCQGMFTWMIETLCAGKDEHSEEWRDKYQTEIDSFQAFMEARDHTPAQKKRLPFWGR